MTDKMSFELKLFDDESTREKFTVMSKMDIMGDDARNAELELDPDEFFEWGCTYRFTIEKVSNE